MVFERYIPPKSAISRPKVTIRPSGLISFDAACVELFDLRKVSYAVLFFDKTRKIIGVKTSTKASEDGSIPFAKRRRSVSVKAPRFLESYALSLREPQKFDASYDESEGLIRIDVKSVRRRRGRRPKLT